MQQSCGPSNASYGHTQNAYPQPPIKGIKLSHPSRVAAYFKARNTRYARDVVLNPEAIIIKPLTAVSYVDSQKWLTRISNPSGPISFSHCQRYSIRQIASRHYVFHTRCEH